MRPIYPELSREYLQECNASEQTEKRPMVEYEGRISRMKIGDQVHHDQNQDSIANVLNREFDPPDG